MSNKAHILKGKSTETSYTLFVDGGQLKIDRLAVQALVECNIVRQVDDTWLELISNGDWIREGKAEYPTILLHRETCTECIRITPEGIESRIIEKRWFGDVVICIHCLHNVPSILASRSREGRSCLSCYEEQSIRSFDILGGVYLVWAENTSIFKIGHSDNVYSRLSGLNTGSPIPLRLIAVFPGDQKAERISQKLFFKQRHRLEWFRFEGDDLKRVYNFYKRCNATFIDDSEILLLAMMIEAKEFNELIASALIGKNEQLYCESFVM